MVGGAVPAVIAAVASGAGAALPQWSWVVLLVGGFTVAQFLAFHDARVALYRAEKVVRSVGQHPLAEQIVSAMEQGQRLRASHVASEDELMAWRDQVDQWARTTHWWLQNEGYPLYAVEFSDMSGLMAADVLGARSRMHRDMLLRLDRHLANLRDIARRL